MSKGAPASPKRLEWIGGSKKDLEELPEEVVHVFGYALYLAQIGETHEQAKPLRDSVPPACWKLSRSGAATVTVPCTQSVMP